MSDRSEPAFPGRGLDERGNTTVVATGMTLRQWYAGMAMQGILSKEKFGYMPEHVAEMAFEKADAMLAHEAKDSQP